MVMTESDIGYTILWNFLIWLETTKYYIWCASCNELLNIVDEKAVFRYNHFAGIN